MTKREAKWEAYRAASGVLWGAIEAGWEFNMDFDEKDYKKLIKALEEIILSLDARADRLRQAPRTR